MLYDNILSVRLSVRNIITAYTILMKMSYIGIDQVICLSAI